MYLSYTIVRLANIAGGLIVAEPLLRKVPALAPHVDKVMPSEQVRRGIGFVEVGLGAYLLLDMLVFSSYWYFGGGMLQALAAILIGLLLCADYFERFSFLKSVIEAVKPYREYIGLGGAVIGILAM